jgi:nucleotide-binding universal stress UspA family protein
VESRCSQHVNWFNEDDFAVNILLPVDGSAASRHAVQFVGSIVAGMSTKPNVTLYHVVETLPEYLLTRGTESGSGYRQVIDDLTATRKVEGERLLQEQRQTLEAAGVPQSTIHAKLEIRDALPEAKKVVAAIAIIEEMKAGNYDVVAMGRRGSSSAEGTFVGTVAEKVLREARGRTIWVIDN